MQKKFPKKHIPETLEGIQAVLEQMEETGVDFENEDRRYYERVEKELLAKLTEYLLRNKKYLR